ncbi:MAG TPA: hypothetical protein VJC17_00070 [Candidatus Dojkabacteria bacterium]|nr:hypothetical protein [Candidatus Dojkabacteria bacterium]
MGTGIPKPAEIQGQIEQMQSQKGEIEENKNRIKGALSELRSRRGEVEGNLAEMENKMQMELPPEFRAQLADRITMLKNARKQIESQIEDLENKLAMLTSAKENLNTAISARKNILQQIAGAIAQQMQIAHLQNRELGRVSG